MPFFDTFYKDRINNICTYILPQIKLKKKIRISSSISVKCKWKGKMLYHSLLQK